MQIAIPKQTMSSREIADHLYVCHFSNGHIKVGRSVHPKSRIASHADRVACLGVELVEHHIVKCVGHAAPAEAALIERCTELATKRNKNEWFEGLDFPDACILANSFAQVFHEFPPKKESKYEQADRWFLAIEKHFASAA